MAEVAAFKKLLIKSGVLDDSKVINSAIKSIQKYDHKIHPYEVWGIVKSTEEVSIDLSIDPIIGGLCQKLENNEDSSFKMTYDKLVMI